MKEDLKSGVIQAGAAQVDITPKVGTHLAGSTGVYRPAQKVLDPLFARALILENKDCKICIIALDLTIITQKYTTLIRQAATEKFGFDPNAVMVHATQTHTAPPLGHFMADDDFNGIPPECEWLRGGEESYYTFAVERIIEAIRLAHESLEPVQIGVGSGIEGRMAFNRRAVTRDGTIAMPGREWPQPLGPTHIRYIEGPIDPELGLVCFRKNDMSFLAMLVNYTCHPVHVFPKPFVSADWPGALAAGLQEDYSQVCVPLVLNGCCGNINPWPPFDPDYVEDHRRMGKILVQMAGKIIQTLKFSEEGVLDFAVEHIKIPFRKIDPRLLEESEKIIRENPEPLWTDETKTMVEREWFTAAGVVNLHKQIQREKIFDYEIQVFRIGRTVIVGLPGEPFVEGQLRIKLASPAYPTYVVHDVSHYVGYLPIKEGVGGGGHEANPSYWSKLVPEALDMVVDNAIGLLKEVFQK